MGTGEELTRLWPAAGLRAAAGELELRWLDDDLLVDVARLAGRGIHDPGEMPFEHPWTCGSAEEVARGVLAYHWANRGHVGPDRVVLELGVLSAGTPVGVQGATATAWAATRSVRTGSWLGREFQGRGIGTRMRALMLHVLFAGLDAREATTSAFADNAASNAVSRRLGYELLEEHVVSRDGGEIGQVRYRMSRERWRGVRDEHARLLGAPVTLEGVDALRAQLG